MEIPKHLLKKSIFDQYCFFLKHYQEKYGPKTTVLMQVGSFYELYGVDNEKMKIGDVKEISILLNIELTRRNKEIRENDASNHLMAGFPCPVLQKFVEILMEHQYTVVIIDQEGTAKDKVKPSQKLPRKVVEILSPGTFISERNGGDTDQKFLVQIHLEGFKQILKRQSSSRTNYQPMLIGISAIDVTTGQSDVYEISNTIDDQDFAVNEIYRYLQTHTPKELIISSNGIKISENELLAHLNLENRNIRYQINYNDVNSHYYKLNYQKQYLEKIFPDRRNMLSVIEYLNLERSPSALVSYIQLLEYTYEHNENLLVNLKRPKIWNRGRLLLLANTAITQLDLHNSNTNRMGSVCNMLNMTTTSMGRRLFKERFLNPIRDSREIEARYQKVDLFLQDDFWQTIENKLKGIIDLDRMHRRIELGLISPNALSILFASYRQVSDLLQIIPDQLLPPPIRNGNSETSIDFRTEFQNYLDYLESVLDFDEVYKYVKLDKIVDNIFKSGYNQELDELATEIRESNRCFDIMVKKMSRAITGAAGSSNVVTLRNTEASGFFMSVTAIRYKALLKSLREKSIEYKVGNRSFKLEADTFRIIRSTKDKSSHNITCNLIENISETITEAIKKLKDRVKVVYYQFLDDLTHRYDKFYSTLSHLVAEIDVYKSTAKSSLKYHYTRPHVLHQDSDLLEDSPSFLQAINFRHPLVEQLNHNSYYVPHSIQLGTNPPSLELENPTDNEIEKTDGMLLYGCNSAGKSSFMKAIGINLVMAQAGMFVPADSFTYLPYHRILTRIIGNDDIYRGDSSFAVEVKELRDILARADPNSLVLGDEICRGTETESGVAIVSAGLMRLTKLKSHFIFATHLHQLTRDQEIMDLTKEEQTFRLGVYHLHVEYDPENHTLIYDRLLRPGSGNAMYGIEVARAMDLDEEFIKEAHRFRHKYSNSQTNHLPLSTSSTTSASSHKLLPKLTTGYGSQVYKDPICQVCGAPSEATHHMKPQCDADSRGFIGSMHKNSPQNQVRLCKPCHHKIDTGELVTNGYKWTSHGRILDYQINQVNQEKPKIIFRRKLSLRQ